MPRILPCLLLLLLAATSGCRSLAADAPKATVTMVEATVSAPNDAERRASTRSADLLTRILNESGITVRRIKDDDLVSAPPKDRLVVLPYNPNPPAEELASLKRHVANGGKLIVFYSADPALARLLGFTLGPLQTPAYEGQWSVFGFDPSNPLLPERIVQTSRILRPALPATPSARIIAWWEDRSGRRQDQPAWTLSDKGAWMSHVLQDGDNPSRTRLVLGLAGQFDAAVLRTAAYQAVKRGGSSTLTDLYRDGRYADVIIAEDRLARKRAADTARQARPVKGEFRAVWNSSGLGLYGGPDSWSRTAKVLAANGIYAVFPHVASAGVAHYPSRLLPQSEAGRQVGDPLAACIAAAQQNGLAVHAWKMCWNLEGAPPDLIARFKSQGRLQVTSSGQTLNWLCPSRADNVEQELAAIAEIAANYAVQGVHLDYIRYPDRSACYCKTCRACFEKAEGLTVAQWPADASKGPLAERYTRWRAGQITRFVKLAGERLRKTRPTAALSAAVYGWYPGCITTLGQDWGDWVKRDLVSFACPMNYTESTAQFSTWLAGQLPLATGRAQIIPGIGVTSVSSRLNGLQTIDQILAARKAGATGFILYDLNNALETGILPLLRLGVTAD